jgi:hypothetical protein
MKYRSYHLTLALVRIRYTIPYYLKPATSVFVPWYTYSSFVRSSAREGEKDMKKYTGSAQPAVRES